MNTKFPLFGGLQNEHAQVATIKRPDTVRFVIALPGTCFPFPQAWVNSEATIIWLIYLNQKWVTMFLLERWPDVVLNSECYN